MKKSVALKWIKALRSGEYFQIKGTMANQKGDSFCCLGVLTNEYCETKDKDFDEQFIKAGYAEPSFYTADLPSEVKSWADFDSYKLLFFKDVKLKTNSKVYKVLKQNFIKTAQIRHKAFREINSTPNNLLGILNDGGCSFKAIATFIENNYKLF